jgi:hypothetical protein
MLHPHTELRFVSNEIGYGIFATHEIPQGTLMWVKDQLDRVISVKDVQALTPANYENLLKYTYRDRNGDYFFCWDLTRYVNHSFKPNSMLTTMGFEIAICDIKIGDEITNDYGTLNIIEPFQCAKGPYQNREFVRPDDLLHFHSLWDEQIKKSFTFFSHVKQPLRPLLTKEQEIQIERILNKQTPIPSVIENLYQPHR